MKVKRFDVPTKPKVLDKLLLALYEALFLDQCIHWTSQGANVCV